MIKWSRVRLYLSILTGEGLFATLRERLQYGPSPQRSGAAPSAPAHSDSAGAVHIHSTYSDGVGTVPEIAEAANRAGLDFIVMCDHSNLNARRDGGWRGRTLVLAGTEVTTDTGHLLALDVPDSYLPASGDAVQAQRAIHDSGGFGYVALPCDLKDHWRDFSRMERGTGLEVFNLSAIARTKISLLGLLLVWLRYRGRRPLRAFHFVAARPDRELALWDRLTAPKTPGAPCRPVPGIASLDAHAVMRFGGREYPYPTYEEVFRTLRTHVLTPEPLTGSDSTADAQAVHAALAAGHCYLSYDNYGDPRGFGYDAADASGAVQARMGDSVSGQGLTLRVRSPRRRSLVRLFHNGRMVAAARGGRLDYPAREPGAYRAEVYLYRRRIGPLLVGAKPWVFSNPIYVQPG